MSNPPDVGTYGTVYRLEIARNNADGWGAIQSRDNFPDAVGFLPQSVEKLDDVAGLFLGDDQHKANAIIEDAMHFRIGNSGGFPQEAKDWGDLPGIEID